MRIYFPSHLPDPGAQIIPEPWPRGGGVMMSSALDLSMPSLRALA